MKKILCLLMVLIMCFSFTAFAADFKDTTNHANREAIDVINTLGIIEGYPNGSFGPNDTLTRAQAVTMLVRAVIPNYVVNYNVGFDDVPSFYWAHDYITTAYAYGIVNGYGNNKFGPEDEVTYVQFAAMLLNTLGYRALELSWPYDVIHYANTLGLFKNTQYAAVTDACTRAGAAQMIYNALPLTMVSKQNNIIYSTNVTLLEAMGYTNTDPTMIEKGEHFGEYLLTFKKNKKNFVTDTIVSTNYAGTIVGKNKVKFNNQVYDIDWDNVTLFVNGKEEKTYNFATGDKVNVVTLYDEKKNDNIIYSIVFTKMVTYSPYDELPADVAKILKKDKEYNPYLSTVTYINEDNYYISNNYVFNYVIDSYTARGVHYIILSDDTVYEYETFNSVKAGDWILINFDYYDEISGYKIFTEYTEEEVVVPVNN